MKDVVSARANQANYMALCVVDKNNEASCMSAPPESPLSDPKPLPAVHPIDVVAPANTQSCVLTKARDLRCWGLGDYESAEEALAKDAKPVLTGVSGVSSGASYVCAVQDGKALCWGTNSFGKAGGIAKQHAQPTEVADVTDVTHIQAAVYHTCAIVGGGKVKCWGKNDFGQSGPADGTVPSIKDAVGLALGEGHSCALLKSGEVHCWGRNHRGQLGTGSTVGGGEPSRVKPPR